MKIAIASTWKAQCGISTYNNYFTSELQKINPDLFILAEYRNIGGPDEDQKSDIPFKECWNRYTGGFDGILQTVEEQKPDILHWSHEFGLFCLNQDTTNQYISLLDKLNKLGIAQTIVYHSVPQMNSRFFSEYFKQSTPFFDKIMAHTDEQKARLIEYGVQPSKIIKINHGVKLCPLYEKGLAKTKLGIPSNKKVIMSMGFFGGLKGVDELIDVYSDLTKTNPNTLFYFVGGLHFATAEYGKEYMKQCFRKIIAKGLKNKFFITGFVNEDTLPWYYGASDLAILNYKPSGYLSASGCSAKLVASKRLILTTDATHRNDELRNGIECLKVHYSKMDDLRQLASVQVEHPDDEIINNAYSYAQDNQWKNVSERYLEEWKHVGSVRT